jgi:acyl-CoA synthetase (AMP-forming)/AMP-acid ligase II
MIDYLTILKNGITIQSSGTSGTAKEFYQSPKKLKAANSVARQVQGIDKHSSIYTCCKITHAGGLLAQTLPGLEIGAKVDIVAFSAYDWVRDIKNYTHTHITPLHAKAIMSTKNFYNLDLNGITITCGADPVTWDIVRTFVAQGARFITNWGMTEIGPLAINKEFDSVDTVDRYASLGPLHSTIMGDTKFCDTDIRNGELYVKGDICIYDDWYGTKDRVVDVGGTLFYLGRTNTDVDLNQPRKG